MLIPKEAMGQTTNPNMDASTGCMVPWTRNLQITASNSILILFCSPTVEEK